MVQILLVLSSVLFVILLAVFGASPFLGLLSIVFLLPYERIGAYSLNPATGHPTVRLVQIASAAFIAAYGTRILLGKSMIRKIPQMRSLLLFAGSAFLSAILVNYFRVWQIYLWLVFIVALFFLLSQLATKKNIRKIGKILFISAVAVALFGLYQYIGDLAGLPSSYTGIREQYSKTTFGFPRIQSTALEPLYFANYLLLPGFVGLGLIIAKRAKVSRNEILGASIIALSFILTMSRGAFLGAFAGLVVLVFLLRGEVSRWFVSNKTHILISLSSVFLLAILALGSASLISYKDLTTGPRIFGELIFTQKVFGTPSYTDRRASQDQGISVFKESPLVGVGLGGYAPKLLDYPSERKPYDWIIVNNQFIELLAETGLVGFSIYVFFLFKLFSLGIRKLNITKDKYVKGFLAGLMAALAAMLVQYNFFSGFFLTHIWVTAALIAGLSSDFTPVRLRFAKIKEIL